MLWAILVPELMVMWAVRQWFEAGQAVEDYHTNATGTIIVNKSTKSAYCERWFFIPPKELMYDLRLLGSKWTRMHGFFLVMGGYS